MLRAVISGRRASQVALIRGEAGIRKTALLRNLLLLEATGELDEAFALASRLWDAVRAVGAVPIYRVIGPDLGRLAISVGVREVAIDVADALEAAYALEPQVKSLEGTALRARGIANADPDLLVRAVEAYGASPRVVDRAFAAEDAGRLLAANCRADRLSYICTKPSKFTNASARSGLSAEPMPSSGCSGYGADAPAPVNDRRPGGRR